jgi:large repetitive protein
MGELSFFVYFYSSNYKYMRFFVFLLLLISVGVNGQPPCTSPGGTPESGIAVCGTLVFPQTFLPNCSAPDIPQGNSNGACGPSGDLIGSGNSIWYKFHCYQSGTLGFLIRPVNPLHDYDWSVMNITGRPASDVLTINLSISSNLSSRTDVLNGATGCTPTGAQNFACGGSGLPLSQFNRMPNIIAGNDYLLMVTKFTPTTNEGYNLEFTGGTAVLTNPLPPSITSVSTVGCNLSQLRVTFSEDILCSSLTVPPAAAAAALELSITNGTNVITSITSTCNSGSNAFTELIINLQNPLSAGAHNLVVGIGVGPGADGNTLLDICNDPMLPASIPFSVNASPPPPTVTAAVALCQGATATQLTATGTNLLWYTTATSGTGSATAPTPFTTNTGVTMYYVSQTIGGCESPRALITVTVNPVLGLPGVTTPITYCQGATAVPLTVTGTGILWFTSPTGGTGSATAPTPVTTNVGTTPYYVSQTLGTCEGARAVINVTIEATPAAPTVTSPITYCQNATSTGLTAGGTNLLWYANATGGTGTITIPFPATGSVGSTTYYVSQTVGNCESPRTAIVVNVIAPPAAPSASTPIIYCQGENATALIATGTGLLWYTVPSGGTGSTTAPTPSTTTASSVMYYVSQSVGTCESPRAAILVIVKPTPAAPSATSPIAYCQGANATALTASGTGLLWYTVPNAGIGINTAPIPSTTVGGSTTYYVSQTNNGCEGPRTAIVVNVTSTPAAPIVTAAIGYCQGTTATALTATGTNLLWYTTATGGTGNTTAPTPSTTALGSTNYYVSQSTNGCEGPRALIVVTVSTTPAAPIVNATITYCQGATATALTATGTNLLWYTQATGGTSSATAPTPLTTAVGTTIYYVSQTFGTCEGPRASITVTVNSTPNAPTVPSATINYCVGATAIALTATGTNLLWYAVPTGGAGSSTAPTPSTTTAASTSYYVSQTTGICEGPRTQVTAVVTGIPAAPVVISPVVYCQGTTASALTTSTGVNLLWYTVPTAGTGSATAPTPLTTAIGSTTYYVSQSTNNCEGPRAAIVVTVNTTPSLPTVITPVIYCQNVATIPLIASGTNLQWYTTATGGTASTITPTPSSTTAGTFTFYVAQKLGNCEGSRAAIVVDITATPTAPTVVTPFNICPNDIAPPLPVTGTNLLWYSAATGGVGSTTAPIPNTAIFPATYTYYVSQSTSTVTGGCEGPRVAIVVTVDNPLQINVGLDSTICEGQSVKLLPVVTPAGATYEWRANGVPLSTIDDRFIKDATVNPIDTGMYILKATLGGCSKEDTLTVNVIWKPIINAGLTKAICLDSSILLKGIVSHNSGDSISYLWSPTDSLATPDALQTLAYPTKTTFYTISFQTKPIYGCDFKGSSVVKLVVQKVDKAFAGNDTVAVKGVPHALMGSGGLNYTWSSPSGINISNPFSQKALVTLNDDAQFYLKVTDAIGCEGRDTIFIKVYNGPTYYVPNSFTPNGDGVNEIFRAIPVGMANTYFRIFNRNGQLMFETSQYLKGWDGTFNGKPQPVGTYVWVVSGKDRDYKKVEMKGTVNLIR